MICPNCQNHHTDVKDSRLGSLYGNHAIRHRRSCFKCGHRFTTFEVTHNRAVKMEMNHLESKALSVFRDAASKVIKEYLSKSIKNKFIKNKSISFSKEDAI